MPAEALWRAQTQRAVQNFPISGRGIEPAQIVALARIKGAAAEVNGAGRDRSRTWPPAIAAAAAHVAGGGYDDQFPVDVFQTGSGTSSNMNTNEVIATLASRELGPACTRTTTSTPRSPATTSSRPRSTWPPPMVARGPAARAGSPRGALEAKAASSRRW